MEEIKFDGIKNALQTIQKAFQQRKIVSRVNEVRNLYKFMPWIEQKWGKWDMAIYTKFLQLSYKVVLCRIIQNQIKDKYPKQKQPNKRRVSFLLNPISIYTKNRVLQLKYSYCSLLNSIKAFKSEILQFLLFFAFLLSEKIIRPILDKEDFSLIIPHKLLKKKDQIQKLSCVIVNWQLTMVKVCETIYMQLYHKYVRDKKDNNLSKRHLSMESTRKPTIKSSMSDIKRTNKNIRKAIHTLSSQAIQLKRELNGIFRKSVEEDQTDNENIQGEFRDDRYFHFYQKNEMLNTPLPETARYASQAFQNIYKISKKKQKKCFRRKTTESISKSTKNENKIFSKFGSKDLKTFTQNLLRYFSKGFKVETKIEEQKNINWNEVIGEIKQQHTEMKKHFTHQRNKKQDERIDLGAVCKQNYWTPKEKKIPKDRRDGSRQNLHNNVIVENISLQEPKQMGIVQFIANYVEDDEGSHRKQPQSMDYKREQKQFLDSEVFDSTIFNYFGLSYHHKLQKALSGRKFL